MHNLTTQCKSQVLLALEHATEPVTAADLAAMIGLTGNRETRRRMIRAIVESLREDGVWVVAANPSGYWLTYDLQTWQDYQEGRKIEAKQILGEAHRRQKMAVDAAGQGLLFGQAKPAVSCGHI
jgi:biotin operon repressor